VYLVQSKNVLKVSQVLNLRIAILNIQKGAQKAIMVLMMMKQDNVIQIAKDVKGIQSKMESVLITYC
jgi:hypothetical protein